MDGAIIAWCVCMNVRALRGGRRVVGQHRVEWGRGRRVFGDGGQTRDFIYVKDIVGALVFAAETAGVSGVFNAGYGGQITINELATDIIRAANSPSRVVHAPQRPGDVRHSRASADKLRAAGWVPRHSLEQGLRATLAYFQGARSAARPTFPMDPADR